MTNQEIVDKARQMLTEAKEFIDDNLNQFNYTEASAISRVGSRIDDAMEYLYIGTEGKPGNGK